MTMRVETPRFGTIEVDDDKVIHFETGLAGFPDCATFIVMDHDRDTPIKWLQCLDHPELAFVIVAPERVLPAFELEVPAPIVKKLGFPDDVPPADVAVFVILNCEGDQVTANLRAPVIVNVAKRLALQLIIDDPAVPLRHPVMTDTEKEERTPA